MDAEINISELRVVINRILDHIEYDLGHTNLKLKQDDYWDVADHERYDPNKSPTDYVVGQLNDDWEFLKGILKNKDQAASYMLIHAAPILRCIGTDIRQ